MAERCVSLWIGPRLGRLERACLRSVLRQGHPMTLFCYRRPDGVPEGAEIRDAAEILPERSILRYRNGSVALFSNWFRYELQRRSQGIWLDTDYYLLAPIDVSNGYLFGWQDHRSINTSIFRAPHDSPLLADLLSVFEERTVPPWLSLHQRLRARGRLMASGRTGLTRMPWGTTGPHALTAVARKHGVEGHAQAPSVFYPAHYRDAQWIRDPSRRIEQMVAPDSIGLHLWNELIKDWKEKPAPAGSLLATLHAEGA